MKFLIIIFLFLLTSSASADTIFNDPTNKKLNEYISSFSQKDIDYLSKEHDGKSNYLLGLIYLKGSDVFDIEKDCSKSIALLQNAWNKKIDDAGYTLAAANYLGECKKRDIKEAKTLAEKTAKNGYILSQRMLGRSYWGREWEELNRQNMEKAIFWLSKAGEAGDRQSAGNLAYIYREGIGVKKNERKSFYWIEKAAFSKFEKGENIVFPSLAQYYEKGVGTEKNLTKAYKYYDLSGTAGAEGKQRIAKDMTQEQIDEAIRESKAWQKENNVEIGGGFIQRAN